MVLSSTLQAVKAVLGRRDLEAFLAHDKGHEITHRLGIIHDHGPVLSAVPADTKRGFFIDVRIFLCHPATSTKSSENSPGTTTDRFRERDTK